MPKTLRNITTREIRLAVKIFVVLWILIAIDTFLDPHILKDNERDMMILFLIIAMFTILTTVIIELFDYTGKALDRESLYSLKLKDRIIVLEATRSDYIDSKHLIIEHIENQDLDDLKIKFELLSKIVAKNTEDLKWLMKEDDSQ